MIPKATEWNRVDWRQLCQELLRVSPISEWSGCRRASRGGNRHYRRMSQFSFVNMTVNLDGRRETSVLADHQCTQGGKVREESMGWTHAVHPMRLSGHPWVLLTADAGLSAVLRFFSGTSATGESRKHRCSLSCALLILLSFRNILLG